jgi:hypothetical protein
VQIFPKTINYETHASNGSPDTDTLNVPFDSLARGCSSTVSNFPNPYKFTLSFGNKQGLIYVVEKVL